MLPVCLCSASQLLYHFINFHQTWYERFAVGGVTSSILINYLQLGIKKNITSSVYDSTVEDVEYIYNTLSLLLLLKMCILSLL